MKLISLSCAIVAAGPAQAQLLQVPFTMKEHFGLRPVVEARIDDTPVTLEVHSGASGMIELTPEAADALGYRDRAYAGRYGIDRSGHVAAAGASRTTLRRLAVGPNITNDAPAFVHALPGAKVEPGGSRPIGMLGIKWLRSSRAIVDFGRGAIGFPGEPADATSESARLVKAGYAALRMTWDEKEQTYTVEGRIAGHPAQFIVNTVSRGYLDLPSAKAAGLKFGRRTGTAGGPSGGSVPVHKSSQALPVELGGKRYGNNRFSAWDTGAYLSRASVTDSGPIQGALGATFWIAHKAAIDFGEGWLFLRQPARSR